MANITPKGPGALDQPSGLPIGSRQGGTPDAANPDDILSQGQVHRTRTEKKRDGDSPADERARDKRLDGEPDLRKHD